MLIQSLTACSKGLTLIELLVSISVTAIVLAVGVPTFKTWVQNMYIRTTTEYVQIGLQLARMEAVQRNTSTRFTLAGTSTTAWTVDVDGGAVIQSRPIGENSATVTNLTLTPTNAVQVTFNRLGRVIANSDSSATLSQIELDVPTTLLASAYSRELRVVISSGGQIRMCNPALLSTHPQGC